MWCVGYTIPLLHFLSIVPSIAYWNRTKHQVGRLRIPNFLDRPHLPYVNALIKELTRWKVALPLGIPHMCREDIQYKGISDIFSHRVLYFLCQRIPQNISFLKGPSWLRTYGGYRDVIGEELDLTHLQVDQSGSSLLQESADFWPREISQRRLGTGSVQFRLWLWT